MKAILAWSPDDATHVRAPSASTASTAACTPGTASSPSRKAASLGVAPADCTVVEDSPVGVRAARAAGMTVLGFAGRTDPAALAGADAVFGAMAELPRLVTPPGCGPRRSAGLRA